MMFFDSSIPGLCKAAQQAAASAQQRHEKALKLLRDSRGVEGSKG